MSRCFITFEGGEGAGKSTLIESLCEAFRRQGRSFCKTRAPGGTAVGQQIRNLILHANECKIHPRAELLLFLADRAQHVEELIRPALEAGKMVLCDRFNDSTVAYQGCARGFDEAWVRELCHFATGGLEPDLTLFLDIDPAVGLKRLPQAPDKIESESLLFHQKIREAYHRMAKREPRRFVILDASLPPEHVLQNALKQIEGRVSS